MRKLYPAIVAAASFAFSAIVYARLPDRIAVHWDIHGDVNGYAGRLEGALLLPIILLVLWGSLRWLPTIDPRRDNYDKFAGTYDLVINTVVTALAAIHVAILGTALGWPIPIDRVVSAAIGIMLIVLGNVLPRARSNWWFGIRTPWTLSNDRVWMRTHRVAGYLMLAGGVVMLLSAAFPVVPAAAVAVTVVVMTGVASVVYSYVAWKRETTR